MEEKAYQKALKYLSYRLRSEKEISDYLSRRFDSKDVKKAIGRLKNEDLINDKRFARAFVSDREKFKPKGERLVFLELKQKGIKEEIVKEVLTTLYSSEKEEELACFLAEKKIKSYSRISKEKAKNRLTGFLLRRGFSYQIVHKAITRLNI